MKKTVLSIVLLLAPLFGIKAQEGPSDPLGYLDFWIGEWEVSWSEGDGKKGWGVNHIQKVLDGKVVQENFEILEGKSKGYKGTSISTYHTTAKKWFQCYADNNGAFYHFVGDLDGDKKIFKTEVSKNQEGKDFVQRMVFYKITTASMTWDWEYSNDNGKTWHLNWRIMYKRKG